MSNKSAKVATGHINGNLSYQKRFFVEHIKNMREQLDIIEQKFNDDRWVDFPIGCGLTHEAAQLNSTMTALMFMVIDKTLIVNASNKYDK